MSETCKNCGEVIANNYCGNCGERTYRRLVMKDLLSDLSSNLFTLEWPILRTIKEMFTRPGKLCREYLDGKRKPYYKPFQYYLLCMTIYYLGFYFAGSLIYDYVASNTQPASALNPEKIEELNAQMQTLLQNNMKWLVFLQVPIYAFFSWAFFKSQGRNYTEMLVATFYIMGSSLLAGVLMYLTVAIHPGISMILGVLFTPTYLTWSYSQLFDMRLGHVLLRSIGIYVCSMISFMLVMGVISLVVLLTKVLV